MKRAALFDADGTLHEGVSIFPLYDVFADEAFIPMGENQRLWEVHADYTDGRIDYHTFATDTLNLAADILKGRRLETARRISDLFYADKSFVWFGYVRPTMDKLTEAGTDKVLITAEPQFIAGSISAAIGMDGHYGSRFVVENDGLFAGNVFSILGSTQKGQIASGVVARTEHSTGYGDSEGDIGMLEIVDEAVCIRPTAELRKHALKNGWTIVDDPDQDFRQAFS